MRTPPCRNCAIQTYVLKNFISCRITPLHVQVLRRVSAIKPAGAYRRSPGTSLSETRAPRPLKLAASIALAMSDSNPRVVGNRDYIRIFFIHQHPMPLNLFSNRQLSCFSGQLIWAIYLYELYRLLRVPKTRSFPEILQYSHPSAFYIMAAVRMRCASLSFLLSPFPSFRILPSSSLFFGILNTSPVPGLSKSAFSFSLNQGLDLDPGPAIIFI